MNICMRALATLGLALLSGHASAIPTLKRVTATFHQAGNSSLNAGVIIEASTSLPVLVIGGGFTITCSTSSLPQTAERLATFSDFFGPDEIVRIPQVVPSSYPIPAWSSVPAGSCSGQCVMQYKAQARDETTLSIRVGSTGVGATFTLIPAGEQTKSGSILIPICRSGQPQCCTPKCAIP